MKTSRRRFLHLAASAAALPAVSRMARAQTYPTKPVRIVVGFAAGGVTDILARLIGQWLSGRLGQQFIIENRPGAGGNLGTEATMHAPPDGYTLLVIAAPNAVNMMLHEKLNFIRNIAPVASIIRTPLIMEVNPSFPANTVPALIAYAKANPGKLNMASAGNGTLSHLAGELFKIMTGVNMIHIAYRGGAPAITDLLGGQVQVIFSPTPASIEFIRSGRLRALAVTTAARSEALPDLPTVGDFVPGYEASGLYGIGAPKNTPIEIIEKLNREINVGLGDLEIKQRLADLGGTVIAGSPTDLEKLIIDETEKWAKVMRASNIKP